MGLRKVWTPILYKIRGKNKILMQHFIATCKRIYNLFQNILLAPNGKNFVVKLLFKRNRKTDRRW